MSSQSAEQTTSPYRMPLAVGIVALSIVIPMAMVVCTALAEMRDKGIATQPSKTVRYYFGSVKQGELWHMEYHGDPDVAEWPSAVRILRLNLETGEERDSGLTSPNAFGWIHWIDGTLYFQTETAVYRQSDKQFVKLAAMPPRLPSGSLASLFLIDGRLATIQPTDEGGYRLLYLSDGKWIDGRPILLPKSILTWYRDEQRDRTVLLPRTSQQPVEVGFDPVHDSLQVISEGNQQHVMIGSAWWLIAYHNGFEFADDGGDVASALKPDNASHDVSGWKQIGTTRPPKDEHWTYVASGRDGLLFVHWGNQPTFGRLNRDGSWVQFSSPIMNDINDVVSDPNEATAYIIGTDQQWGSAKVARIKGNGVEPIHLTIRGCEREYLARWKRLGLSLFVAWLLHIALLIGGSAWLTRDAAHSRYDFGNQQVLLAQLWRRAIATGIDLVLVLAIAAILGRLLFAGLGFPVLPAVDETQLANGFFNIEQSLVQAVTVFQMTWAGPLLEPFVGQFLRPFAQFPQLILILFAALLILVVVSVFLEGRHGVTPGKWLLGLRTVRTTLRPCGVARAIVRNVFYCFDLPLLLTPLPAAISLMFSDHRQRLGDRAADTIVVRAGSMREVS